MSRRTKLILFIVGTLVLFGLVGWFIVWPTLKPLLPAAQPPALPGNITPQGGTGGTGATQQQPGGTQPQAVAAFQPSTSPDAEVIADLSRRAGVLAERVESGSSENGFANLDDAQLGVSPGLAETFRSMQTELRTAHPASGPSYITVARGLTAIPEADVISGSSFRISVQLQMQIRDDGNTSTSYREATVTFVKSGDTWIASAYGAKPFAP